MLKEFGSKMFLHIYFTLLICKEGKAIPVTGLGGS
jgi:hypothetical protein